MISALWEIAAVLDEERTPASVPNSVWLTIPTARLRGPDARQDNVWLRECLERMTGLKLSGQHRGDEWIAVLLAEAHFIEGGSKVRLLVPPAGVHALRSPGNFVKIVRRVPVKIVIDSGLPADMPMPLGLSVVPTVTLE